MLRLISKSFFLLGFLAGCSACGNGDGCALLAIEAAMPVLLPVAIVGHAVALVKAPFDPVYASFVGQGGTVEAAWRYDLPVSASAIEVSDDGAVTGYPISGGRDYALCSPLHGCVLAPNTVPSARPAVGCRLVSPNGAFCVMPDRGSQTLFALPGHGAIAVLPRRRYEFGTFDTVSNMGEVFLPSAAGYDRVSAAGIQHIPVADRVIAAARLGSTPRMVEITGGPTDRHWPPVLHLRATPGGVELATAVLPADVWLLMGVNISPDGAWCAVTYAPHGGSGQRISLFHMVGSAIMPAATIAAPADQMAIAFAPSSRLLAVLNTGSHDRQLNSRASVFRL